MRGKARYEMDMTSGPILINMIRFAVPLMVSSVLQLLYNAADMIVVGRFAGSDALAAVGATGSITGLLVNLFLGVSVGASVSVAQHYGASRYKDISESVHSSVALSLLSGVAIGLIGLIFARPILAKMGTPKEVLDRSVIYMQIYSIGMPANLAYNFAAAVLRAVGDTRRPLYYLMIAGVVNVILNLIFVICFRMHVIGVALATVISQVISMTLVIICLMRTDGSVHLSLKKLRLHGDKVLEIARVGLPAGLQSSMFSISNMLIQSSINTFGAAAIAGNTAAANVESFVSTPLNAFAKAAMSFAGQSFGAKKPDRIKKSARCGVFLVVTFGLVLGALAVFFRRPLIRMYTSDAAAVEWGATRLLIMEMFCLVICSADVFISVLRATGNSLVTMLMSIVTICGFRILWLYTVFAAFPTCEVLYWSYPISWILATISHFITYKIHTKKVFSRMYRELAEMAADQV